MTNPHVLGHIKVKTETLNIKPESRVHTDLADIEANGSFLNK